MLFLVFVLLGVRSGVAPEPEVFYKRLPFFVRFQAFERLLLLIRDDVDDVLVHPLLPRAGELFLQLLLFLSDLLLREWFRYGFGGTAGTAGFGVFVGLRIQRTCKEQSRRRDAHRWVRAEGRGKLHRINDLYWRRVLLQSKGGVT